jgi:predicted secreted protein
MQLPVATAIAIYITIWWITLLAVLPFFVRSQHESGEATVAGHDPGAPVAPQLLRKAAITTGISIVVFALFLIGMKLAS